MFKSLTVRNFRGISNLLISDFKRVNLLVGRNNCGKTSILEAIFCVSNPGNPQLPVTTANLRGYIVADERSWALFFHNLGAHKPINLEAELASPHGNRILTITPHRQSRAAQVIASSRAGIVTEQIKGFAGTEIAINGLDLDFEIKDRGAKDAKKFKSSVYFEGVSAPNLLGGAAISPLRQETPQNYSETLKASLLTPSQIGNPKENFGRAQSEKRIDRIVAVLREIEPALTSLSLGLDYIEADIGLKRLVPINVMGDGIVRALATLLAMSSYQDGILLIDEIETGLHYSALTVLWKAILKAAIDFNVQVVATTHSKECAAALNQLDSGDDIGVFRIERAGEEHEAVQLDKTSLSTALANEWEFR